MDFLMKTSSSRGFPPWVFHRFSTDPPFFPSLGIWGRLGAAREVQQLQMRCAADNALQRLVGEELATAEAQLLAMVNLY